MTDLDDLDGWRASVAERLRAAGSVFAEDEAALLVAAADSTAELTGMVDRRVDGLPLELVVGWADFMGLRVAVEPGVFVPRRRTELLAREAIASARPGSVVVDLCCGTGAVGLAVARAVAEVTLYAVDVDPAAVRCARGNLPDHARVLVGDLYEPLHDDLRGAVGLLVVNAPYVPTAAIRLLPREARLHEPTMALDGGPDGMAVQGRVLDEARSWLADHGRVVMETSRDQAPALAARATDAGLATRLATSADLGATVLVGTISQ